MEKSSGVPVDAVRKFLRAQILRRRETFQGVSKAIGKNHAYLQQYFERGIPKTLPYKTAVSLAEYLDVEVWKLLDSSLTEKKSFTIVFSESEKFLIDRYRKIPRKGKAEIERFLKSCELSSNSLKS